MATNLLGIPNSNVFVPYTAATKRSKQLDIGTYTTCDAAGWSCGRGVAMFYADSNGVWRVIFNIRGTVTGSSRSDASIAIAGIIFKNATGYYSPVSSEAETVSAIIDSSAVALFNDNKVKVFHASNSTTVYAISGDVELNAEPTWASLGTTASAALEGVMPVDVFIPPASASESGLVTAGAQTFAGNKTHSGFTSFGSGNTGLKCKILTGTTAAAEGGSTAIAHGLTGDKIVGVNAIVKYATNQGVIPAFTSFAEYNYDVTFDATNVNILLHATSSGSILSKAIAVMVWYVE